jgi:hypothetical protein
MDMNYIDDFAWVVKKNLFSLTGFWFDCVTSIPWSCFDMAEYLVFLPAPPHPTPAPYGRLSLFGVAAVLRRSPNSEQSYFFSKRQRKSHPGGKNISDPESHQSPEACEIRDVSSALLCFANISGLIRMLRIIQDYVVLYFGSSIYKIARLLAVAMISVHLFACAFYRVKRESAVSPEDVDSFYESRNVRSTVCSLSC